MTSKHFKDWRQEKDTQQLNLSLILISQGTSLGPGDCYTVEFHVQYYYLQHFVLGIINGHSCELIDNAF